MVKCRSLIWKYFNSEPVNIKKNPYNIAKRNRLYSRRYMANTSKSSHRPKWRRVCDDWVDRRLEGRQGVTTPVHVLYNTYLNENPMHYMDIAQFGKVLKSRFKNQKCRRGGQGAQIYVYKNVAIKSLDETKGDVSLSGPRLAPSSDVTPPLPCSATLSDVTASHPRPATTSDAFPPLPCSATLTDATLSPSRSATPTDVRGPSPTQPTKRKASPESSIIPKKRKFIFENSLPQVTPPDSPSAEFFVSRSEHSASPAAPSVASQQEPGERAACGKPPQFLANVSNSNDPLLSDANNEKLSRSKHWSPALVEDSGGTADLTLDYFSKKLGLKRIAFEKDSTGNKNHNESNVITTNKTDNIIPPIASENLSDSKTLTPIENVLSEIEKVNSIISINSNSLCSSSPQSQAPKYNLRPASKAASVAPEETILWDEEQRESGQESPVEAQGISCRMAVGRKWVDAQLRDEPGARTFAWEVAAAYARDHPDEPLPDTSIAVLIRNKFPSRRKAFKQGPVTTYYFQDLELVNRRRPV
ncbi:verprolin-like isoform X1 [Penaeus chinensis]|uniref:verprolin-like isoform X1 n=1 Tax=Penaeus chinensis TaxID=139456 RepID=UPI001FB7BE7C|nr:verprolin-like isoform X1 [Penaeus chinensis]